MASIAVIGSNGYVGGALYQGLVKHSEHQVASVTRENYESAKAQQYDIIINCAMPSGRFWAKNNPEKDFVETVQKTANLVYGWQYKKFIQISTVSARNQLDTVYGRHKAAAEQVCNFGENLIVRLGVIYSLENTKGVLVDMLQNKPVFMSGSSKFSFIPLEFCVNWIISNLNRTGVVELGGKNPITLESVAQHIGSTSTFEGEVTNLDSINTTDDLPQAATVLEFLNTIKKHD